MIAILEAQRAGLLQRTYWINNIVSGFTVGIVALPLAMAFAIASGAKPEQGLYTAIVAGLAVSLFGGSRLQIAGPTGAFIAVLAGITATHGYAGLQIATLLAGCILVLLGVARLGNIIKFIPDPVIVGFTAGIGVIIWVGQWSYFFGFPSSSGLYFHDKLWYLLQSFNELHLPTTLVGLASLLIVIFTNRIPYTKRVPGPLLALVFAGLMQFHFEFAGVATIGSMFGEIPRDLPSLQLPDITFTHIVELIGPAFAIAMLGAIESLLSAVVADSMTGTRHDSNQELIGQGIANILTPLFGGFAATGAIARTATSIRNGGNSPLSGIIHAATLILVIVFAAPLASHIPLATLAAILFVVAWNLSEMHRVMRMLRRAPRADVVILLVTLFLTVFVDLVVAVNIGVILATLHFLRRMAASVEVSALSEEDYPLNQPGELAKLPKDVMIFRIDGPFFFAAAESFERALTFISSQPRVVIISLRRVPFVDITAIGKLEHVMLDLQKRHIRILLAEANALVTEKLERAGLLDLAGREQVFTKLSAAIISAS